ncbi:MAG TPA: TonB-dependent receptor [Candidatus Acidoferrum sp.]|nr:TonB-dependent receptor [Candidatus Acidoferrum sp.]
MPKPRAVSGLSRTPVPAKPATLAAAIVTACAAMATALPSVAAAADAVEEITVVGQGVGSLRLQANNDAGSRLGLTALETPASVDLITRDEIISKGDYSAMDSITRSAGISTSANNGNGGIQVSSRGFNGQGTTVFTYDGTRLYITAGTVTFPADTWTLDRVEVLRGAGSVINGVGALATTINYVPRTPQFDADSFEGQLAVGSYGMKRVAVDGNVRLSSEWAARADVAYEGKDGYQDRADEDRKVAALSLLYAPNADFRMRFSLDYADVNPSSYFGTPLIDGVASDAQRKNNYNFADSRINYRDVWARVHTDWRLSNDISFRNDTFVIQANREWQNLEEYYYNDTTKLMDRVSYLGIKHDERQIGTRGDFLFTGKFNGMDNRFTIGAEVNDVDLTYSDDFNSGGFDYADSVPVFGFSPGLRPTAVFTQPDFTSNTKQYGLFFDDVLKLNSQWSLVIGGRYDTFSYDRVTLAQVTGRARSEFGSDYSKFTWRAGAVYEISSSLSVYAQASIAADPVSSPISINAASANFHLSPGRQYEVGLKQQFSGGEYTLAYFDITKKDMVTRLPGATVDSQIGQQSSSGVEATLRLNPLPTLSIDLNAAFIDAVYDTFYSGSLSLSGNTPNGAPKTTANVWVNWTPIPKLQLGAGARYVAARFADDENTDKLPAYTVVDASVSWQLNAKSSLTLRVRNLTNEKDYVLSEYVPGEWLFGEPRAYELGLHYSF